MKLGFWKLKVTVGTRNKGVGPNCVVSQSDQPTQVGHLFYLDSPYQQ
jgi:hypothetical protein